MSNLFIMTQTAKIDQILRFIWILIVSNFPNTEFKSIKRSQGDAKGDGLDELLSDVSVQSFVGLISFLWKHIPSFINARQELLKVAERVGSAS